MASISLMRRAAKYASRSFSRLRLHGIDPGSLLGLGGATRLARRRKAHFGIIVQRPTHSLLQCDFGRTYVLAPSVELLQKEVLVCRLAHVVGDPHELLRLLDDPGLA
ncbi:hypothetical protein [Variovorax paradoxus]|uniref:hypothetical protein n=1 Tax=Variovorax paradoxus TaxID=34073 RepID=UPI002788F734|nr:hypothetical protein [Variovorax paradoxus]MDQ0586545.1 hypothetical protein [Variovorax paradoxus]